MVDYWEWIIDFYIVIGWLIFGIGLNILMQIDSDVSDIKLNKEIMDT